MPVCFYPSAPGSPVVFFSPGYGGARSGYSFLARHWNEQGLAVAVTEHAGSNQEALARLKQRAGRDFPREVELGVARDQEEYAQRLDDIRLARRELTAHAPNLDWSRVGLAGHSYGSATVMGLAPEWQPFGLLLLSPPFLGGPSDAALERIQAPTLFVTGTRDSSLTGSRTYHERLETFRRLRSRPRYLAVFEGAEHLTFAGIGLKLDRWLPSVRRLTTRFWEGCLEGRALDPNETFEAVSCWEAA